MLPNQPPRGRLTTGRCPFFEKYFFEKFEKFKSFLRKISKKIEKNRKKIYYTI
jgi:hypothetical protein